MSPRSDLPTHVLDEVIHWIVEVAQPERIILFGSAAHGEAGPDGDLELPVVADVEHRRETERRIYRRLVGVGIPVDVVVTARDIGRYGDGRGLVIRPALREGKVVYDASGALSAR